MLPGGAKGFSPCWASGFYKMEGVNCGKILLLFIPYLPIFSLPPPVSGWERRGLAQTELLALVGFLSFAYLSLSLGRKQSQAKWVRKNFFPWSLLLAGLPFGFPPYIVDVLQFNLGEECDFLVCLLLLSWCSGNANLGCLFLLGMGTQNTLQLFCFLSSGPRLVHCLLIIFSVSLWLSLALFPWFIIVLSEEERRKTDLCHLV